MRTGTGARRHTPVRHRRGDRPQGPLFRRENGLCLPYPAAAEPSLRVLGPPIDPAAFAGAVYYGAR